jgi:hypothetical protein
MTEKDQTEDKAPFPAGFPKPHEVEEWARSTKTQFLTAGVAEVSQEMIPEGKFDYIFPSSMLAPPPKLPKDASWSESMKHRQMQDDIERRRLHNDHVQKKRDEWFNDGNNTIFHIITDSMVHTAPGLRKTLKDKHVREDGRYDGVKAAKDVAAWLERLKIAFPQEDYYDGALAAIKKKRLPAGCSEKTFQAVLRRVRFDINPYTTTPYAGEKLGRFIIRKILPPYTDAAENLEARLIAKGELGDIEKVSDECATIVANRATASAFSALPEQIAAYLALDDEHLLQEGDQTAPVVDGQLGDKGKKPTAREPKQVDPKKGIFCKWCPHKARATGRKLPCASNPNTEFNDVRGARYLLRLTKGDPEGLQSLRETREKHAQALGATAKPLPSIDELKTLMKGSSPPNAGGGLADLDEYEDDIVGSDTFDQLVDVTEMFMMLTEDDEDEPEPTAYPKLQVAGDDDDLTLPPQVTAPAIEERLRPEKKEKRTVSEMDGLFSPSERDAKIESPKREAVVKDTVEGKGSPKAKGGDRLIAPEKGDGIDSLLTPAVPRNRTSTVPPRMPTELTNAADRHVNSSSDDEPLPELVRTNKTRLPRRQELKQREAIDKGEKPPLFKVVTGAVARAVARVMVAAWKTRYHAIVVIMSFALGLLMGVRAEEVRNAVSATSTAISEHCLRLKTTMAEGATAVGIPFLTVTLMLTVGTATGHISIGAAAAAPAAAAASIAVTNSDANTRVYIESSVPDGTTMRMIADNYYPTMHVAENITESVIHTTSTESPTVADLEHKGEAAEKRCEEVSIMLGASQTVRCVADTGAGMPFFPSEAYFRKGTLHDAPVKVNGSLGSHTTKKRGEAAIVAKTVGTRFQDNGFHRITYDNAVLNPRQGKYVLLPLADMSVTHNCETWLPAGGKDGWIRFDNNVKVVLQNKSVALLDIATPAEVAATLCQPICPMFLGEGESAENMGAGVIFGKKSAMSNVTSATLHRTFGHKALREMKKLPKALADFPEEWYKLLKDEVCDACLRADAPRLGPTGHFPKDDGLLVFDAWHTPVPCYFGGQRIMIGFTHYTTKVRKSYRVNSIGNDAMTIIDAAFTYFNHLLGKRNDGSKITWIHSDRAWPLTQKAEVHALASRTYGSRITTSAPNKHRGNPQEGTWKVNATGTRRNLMQADIRDVNTGKLDPRWWALAWEEWEEVNNLLPRRDDEVSPMEKITHEKPRAGMRRPWGCLAYINDPRFNETQKGNKVTTGMPTALRAIHVGFNHSQPLGPPQTLTTSEAYVCFCPELGAGDGRLWVGTDARFVPECFPGVRRSSEGGLYIPSPEDVMKEKAHSKPDKATGETVEVKPDQGDKDTTTDQFEIYEMTPEDVATQIKAGGEPNATPTEKEEADFDTIDPNPVASGKMIEVLWTKDGKYYRAMVTNAFRTKTSRKWRHEVSWDATDHEWRAQVLNLEQEDWRPVPDNPEQGHPDVSEENGTGEADTPTASTSTESIADRVKRTRRAGMPLAALARADEIAGELEHLGMSAIAEDLHTLEVEALTAALAADHEIKGSPGERDARKDYAAATAAAALMGVSIPPYEPAFYAVGTDTENNETCVTMAELFQDEYDGKLCHGPETLGEDGLELLLAARKAKPGVISLRQQLRSPEKVLWEKARQKQLDKLRRHGTLENVRADDKRVVEYLKKHGSPVDIMVVGTRKYDERGHVLPEPYVRLVLRGDQMDDLSSNDKNSPTVRCEGYKCSEANATLREQDEVQYDYEAAYLNSVMPRFVVARAPMGMREYDEDGTELYWIVVKALYGGADSGALWYGNISKYYTEKEPEGLDFNRSHADPCVFGKTLADGSLCNTLLHVDDGKFYNDPTPAAKAEVERLKVEIPKKFNVTWHETNAKETVMLGANNLRISPSKKALSMKAYITKQVELRLPKPLTEYPKSWGENPCGQKLMEDYERAMTKNAILDGAEYDEYGGLVGALQYATVYRPDISFPVGIGGRCRTFPNKEMKTHMERVLVYLGLTADLSLVYDGKAVDARKLVGRVDSDWHTRRSTTGYYIRLANAAICHGSRRQHCIAMSTTEAEMMGLAELALEILYIRSILRDLGHEFDQDAEAEIKGHETHKRVHQMLEKIRHEATEAGTDNSGAFDLCHRDSTGKNSRHVQRRVFKMRELKTEGSVKLALIPTAEMAADMMTKTLADKVFHRHRRTTMNCD